MLWRYIGKDGQLFLGDAVLCERPNPTAMPINKSSGTVYLITGYYYEWKKGQPSDAQMAMDGFVKVEDSKVEPVKGKE